MRQRRPTLGVWWGQWYSPVMVHVDYRTKALLIAVSADPLPVQACINRLVPEFLCFVVSESQKGSIESDVQPTITKMP